MKKLLLCSVIIFLSKFTFAQKIDWGVKLGLTNSALTKSYKGTTNGTTINPGGYTNVDIAVFTNIEYNNFTIQPGIGYYLKGGGYEDFAGYTYAPSSPSGAALTVFNTSLRLYYVEIPVNAIYNIPVKAGKIFIGAGPYVALAVAGKMDYLTTQINASSEKTTSGINFDYYPRFDYGINLLTGFRFNKGIELGIGYGSGLQNISINPNFTAHNSSISITVGYFFK